MAPSVLAFDIWVMLAVALACLPVFMTGREIARWEGAVFLGYYAAYVAYLILAAQQHDSFVLPITVITLVVSRAAQAGRAGLSLALIALLPWLGAALLLALPPRQRVAAAGVAGAVALAALGLLLTLAPALFAGELLRWRVEWLPQLGMALGFRLDGLAWLLALLITGIGALVVLYAAWYLAPEDPAPRFFAFLLLFMGAMLGVVLADNLLLLVLFWELTSLSSFLLIGYWHHRQDARRGARMALT
jgi:hypothetical protein